MYLFADYLMYIVIFLEHGNEFVVIFFCDLFDKFLNIGGLFTECVSELCVLSGI